MSNMAGPGSDSSGPPSLQLIDPTGGFLLKGLYQLVITTAFWSVFAATMPVLALVLLPKRTRTRANIVLFIIIFIMFSISTAYWIVLFNESVTVMRIRLVQNQKSGHRNSQPDPEMTASMVEVLGKVSLLRVVESWPRIFNFTLGDGIVVWRCISLYDKRIIKSLMVSLLVVSGGFSLYDGIKTTLDGEKSPELALSPGVGADIDTVAVFLSFLTNLVASVLFSWKAWTHRQFMREMIGQSRGRSMIERILYLIMESSVIYCLIQLVNVILNAISVEPASSLDIASGTYFGALNVISGLYPALLICLVAKERTSLQSLESSNSSSNPNSQTKVALPIEIHCI